MITQREIDRIAAEIRAGGLPDAFNRWLTMTPESYAAYKARLASLTTTSKGVWTMRTSVQEKTPDHGDAAMAAVTTKPKKAKKAKAENKTATAMRDAPPPKAEEPVEKPAEKKAASKRPPVGKLQVDEDGVPIRRGAFEPNTAKLILGMLKKGTTIAKVIDKAEWTDAADPVLRVKRFIDVVAKGDHKLKVKFTEDGDDVKNTKLSVA
jgi:hypothetical protein